MSELSRESLVLIRNEIRLKLTQIKANRWIDRYQPYDKQRQFHAAGRQFSERLFLAGNQLGKTLAGGCEIAYHVTGQYPDWWNGAVFKDAPKFWVAGVTGESTRDNPQRILVGPPQIQDAWGTGTIPKDAIKSWSLARGIPDALDSLVVKHKSGKDSIVLFKSYEKGRTKWQGDTIDGVWFDEEPPLDIYSEGRTRTVNGQLGVFAFITFTPLLGMSEVVRMFLNEDQIGEMKVDENLKK